MISKESNKESNDETSQLLEIAKQAAIKHLFVYYKEMPPVTIKIFLACISQATILKKEKSFSLSNRPSIRSLASSCNLSKDTVQKAVQYLTERGLLDEDQPTLMLDKATKYFNYSYLEEKIILLEIDYSKDKSSEVTFLEEFNKKNLAILENKLDDELILLYQKGVKESFTEIYKRYFETIRMQICKQLPEGESYDLAQEVFLELMEKLKTFQVNGQAKFSTWIYKFTKLFLANARRKIKREVQLSDDFDIEQVIRLTSPQKQIAPYLLTLDKIQQECVLLHYYEGLSYENISVKLGIDKKLVRTYLQTARRHIRSLLNPEKNKTINNKSIENKIDKKIAKKLDNLLYDKFFYSTLEKKVIEIEKIGGSFVICILYWNLTKNYEGLDNSVVEKLSSLIINNIRSIEDQAFNLGDQYFAIVFSNMYINSVKEIIRIIMNNSKEELGSHLEMSCLMSEYKPNKSLKLILQTLQTKLQIATLYADTIFFVD
ncbi:MAG: sigma-70 family RNA polymerase sigma factor [Blastocatellia bacterium]